MRLSRLLMLLFLCIAAPAAARNMDGVLVAETAHPRAAEEVVVALVLTPHPGWHGYWANPGEAGFAPAFDWTLPKGVLASTPDFPVPQTLIVAGLANYVFEGQHALLFRIKLPKDLATGTRLPLSLAARYLVCSDQVCVPEQATFALTLTIGDAADRDARFDGWRARLPAPLAADAHFSYEQPLIRFAIPYPANAALADPRIYPVGRKAIIDSSPQAVARVGDTLIVTTSAAPNFTQASVAAVLAIGGGRGLSFTATPGPVPAVPVTPRHDARATVLAILGAVLGGLILNVMPCVFPILSLKALSLAHAGGDERTARREALAYAAGAIVVLTALGALVLALKVGWAFQLQDPRVVLILFVLMVALTLNLLGVFELPTIGGGTRASGGFATGALAAFVATPCTGPFMGAALGAALVLPPVAALGVFAGLGLGLALPFLAIGFIPALRRKLPKPGQWMVTLRRVLAVPMAATALWLGWVLWRQTGSSGGAIALAGVAVVILVLIAGGRRQHAGRTGLGVAAAAAVVATIASAALIHPKSRATTPGGTAGEMASGERFSEARLAQLVAAKKPVFVYFTADWCLTCKVNEKAAIDRDETRAAFKKAGVTTLVGDWTDGDATIGAFLRAHGRAGVPLYLYYAPGEANARELPQILTPETLIRQTQS